MTHARGLCSTHRYRQDNGLDLNTPVRRKKKRPQVELRNTDGARHCIECEEWLDEAQFTPNSSMSDGLNSLCKICNRCRRHGITKAAYLIALERQGGGCGICGVTEGILHIDHDHNHCPGKNGCEKCFRGLLCEFCNRGLGMFRDNYGVLRAAMQYLREKEAENGRK